MADWTAAIVLFALDELRARYGGLTAAGADPRLDTAPFRAFRAALLDALSAGATAPAEVSMWWEGGFDAYALAVAVGPPGAVPNLDRIAAAACVVDAYRLAPPRRDRYPLARLAPGHWDLSHDADGATVEAPFGAPSGHFGAPGMRRIT